MDYLIYVYIFLVGLFIGSFLNVLADRLSKGITINGRSKCESCKHVLAWNDLIPVISYIWLSGKCRYCRASISMQYPLSEILTGVLFVLTWTLSSIYFNFLFLHILHLFLVSTLIVIILADFRYQIIPDEMQITLFVISIANFIFFNLVIHKNLFQQILTSRFIGSFGMYLVGGLAALFPILMLYLITRGRGMGFGDVKLAANIGLLLGLWNGLLALYVSFVIGGAIGILLLTVFRRSLKTKIAFGPFLVIGLYTMLFFENWIWEIISRVYKI